MSKYVTRPETIALAKAAGGGGGGGGEQPGLIGFVSETSALPTVRPSGSSLLIGDYVKVDSNAHIPFTLVSPKGTPIDFTDKNDIAIWNGNDYQVQHAEGGQVFTDVEFLPAENISDQTIYRTRPYEFKQKRQYIDPPNEEGNPCDILLDKKAIDERCFRVKDEWRGSGASGDPYAMYWQDYHGLEVRLEKDGPIINRLWYEDIYNPTNIMYNNGWLEQCSFDECDMLWLDNEYHEPLNIIPKSAVSYEQGEYKLYYNPTKVEAGYILILDQNNGGGSGTQDYNELNNKPQINNIPLQGNKTADDLGLGIKDVESLPTEDISKSSFYRIAKEPGIYHKGIKVNESKFWCYSLQEPYLTYSIVTDTEIIIKDSPDHIDRVWEWDALTDMEIGDAIFLVVGCPFKDALFCKYEIDHYDAAFTFTQEDESITKLYHNPTGDSTDFKEIIDIDNNEFIKKSTFLNTIYPTGSIVFTYNKVSPATYIGGEWELIEEGYYPVSTVQNTIESRLLNAELPNIKGKWGGAAARSMRDIEGAFEGTTAIQHGASWGGSGNDDHVTITPFDASKGQVNADGTTYVPQEESVYKDGGKVQPKSILLYMWRRIDNGTLTYNFVNISFSENDFIVNPTTGQISLRNAIYYYTPNNIPKADNTGKLIDSGININDIVLKTRKVAGIPLDHDITEQEIANAIKDIEVELKNKTINADNNTITNLETDNFKDSALAKSTDNVRDYESSSDKKVATEKFLQKTLLNIETPENNKDAANKKYVDDEIQKVVERTFTFKGFVSPTAPADNIKIGSYWYESATLPTTFPINVKTYDGTSWSSTTTEYNPSQFDYWVNNNDNRNYFWNGNNWRIFDSEVLVDNVTIKRNNEGKLEVEDDGISKDKLNSNVADNNTIEKDSTNGLKLKDGGITFEKFNSDLTKQSLANDYYFKFSDGTNTYYTKTIVDGENIDVYAITITNNKIIAITLQETKGTLANGVLTFSSVEYAHNVFGDGFYVVGDDEILITISALQDILEKAGRVNDVKVAGISQVKNKEANIQTIDNIEDNFYYAFKNGSTYYYTKSKATGSTAYYQFTYADNVLTKIENKGNVTVELNANRVPQITISSVIYTLDETKNDYYIINPKQKLPSIENEIRDLTEEELNRIFDNFYITPPNPSWKYVGILSASNGSTLKVEDDWTELLLVMRVSEGSSYYNLTSVIPKYGFAYGNPNGNNTFAGFFWNESYNCKMRVGLEGTGSNRVVKQNYVNQVGWVLNGTYVFKR